MHTQLDLTGSIPTFIEITDGKVHDVNILDLLNLEPNAFYTIDRACLDFERLYKLHRHHCYFYLERNVILNSAEFIQTKLISLKDLSVTKP